MLKEAAMCRLFTVAMSVVVLASPAAADILHVPGDLARETLPNWRSNPVELAE